MADQALEARIARLKARALASSDPAEIHQIGLDVRRLRAYEAEAGWRARPEPSLDRSIRMHLRAMTRRGATPQPPPNVPPMPIFAFIREEGLRLRFNQARIWDPEPTSFGLGKALELAIPGIQLLQWPGQPWEAQGNQLPSRQILSVPARKRMGDLVRFCIDRGADYLAVLVDVSQLSGRHRWDGLYSAYPPSRAYVLSEQWTAVAGRRIGSTGCWRPGMWLVWDGGGQAIQAGPKTTTTLRWLPDRIGG